VLFGAYPRERASEVEGRLRGLLESYSGAVLPAAEAYRVWGERFFPAVPSRPTPKVARNFVSVAEVLRALGGALDHPGHGAIQGTVARSGEVLILTFDAREESREVSGHNVQL
jgi:hypothetical protein